MPGYVAAWWPACTRSGGGLLAIKMIGVVAAAWRRPRCTARARCCSGARRRSSPGSAVRAVARRDRGRQRHRHGHAGRGAAGGRRLVLVRDRGRRPLGAPCSTVSCWGWRPTCARSRCRWRRWRAALPRAGRRAGPRHHPHAAACLVAFLVLLPWGIRNRLRYGEFFLTDSHGGHTALVGANPNSDGVYSRSLNRMFARGPGTSCSRAAPRGRSRGLRARQAVDGVRAEVRAGAAGGQGRSAADARAAAAVLADLPAERAVATSPREAWFTRHRPASSASSTGSGTCSSPPCWWACSAAFARRNGPALSLLPMPLALAALYVALLRRGPLPLPSSCC